MQSWPSKDPQEVLDYQFDWTARLAASETITTSTFLLESGSVVLGTSSIVGALTKIWLSGGTLGEVNVITNRIVTNQARTYDSSANLRIRSH